MVSDAGSPTRRLCRERSCKIGRLAHRSARWQRQLDAPQGCDSSTDRIGQISHLRGLLRQSRSQDVSRFILHRPVPLRRPQPQLSLHGLVEVADRDARHKGSRSEIIAINLITAAYTATRMHETLLKMPAA